MDTYEKKYKEALKDMMAIYPNLKGDAKLAVEHAFPELAESEDERIRQGLIKLLTVASEAYLVESTGIKKDSYLAWLEKQKEQKPEGVYVDCTEHPEWYGMPAKKQKPTEWSEEDERMRQTAIEACKTVAEDYENSNERFYKCKYWLETKLKSLRPVKQEWSEEDRLHYANVLEALEYVKGCKSDYDKIEAVKSDIVWFKSLRPSWKPSEDEERLINTSISFIKDFADRGYENAVECIDWLKSKLNGNACK